MTAQKQKVTFEDVQKALASLDERFVVFRESDSANVVRNYCSIRLLLSDKTVDKTRIFCLYYNASSVTIHCAKRFECDDTYHLSKDEHEYTKSVKLDALQNDVDALLTKECIARKMSAYEAKKATASKRKVKKAQ